MTGALAAAAAKATPGWWQHVLATGALPAAALAVRRRLVREVGSVELPEGRVFLKVMAFPRWSDRVRYLLRSLPAAREAAMLSAVAQAGVPCPEVLAVRTARRRLLPHRSLLVLAALAEVADAAAPAVALRQRAELARRLCDHGLFHPDLNPDNFLRLQDGRLAVLDVQSMRRTARRKAAARAMAARLLLEASEVTASEALSILAEVGLARRDDAGLEAMAVRQAHRWLRQRIGRCLQTSTEFVRRRGPGLQVEHRRRGDLPEGRWHSGGRELERCWVGQRLLEVLSGRPPRLPAFRRRAWLPGVRSVYIPTAIAEERVPDELRILTEAYLEFGWLLRSRSAPGLAALQHWRTRGGTRIVDDPGSAWH